MWLWLTPLAEAWGPTGHRVVGMIAEAHLERRVQRELAELTGPESLAWASTWPDEIRSDPTKAWTDVLPPDLAALAREHAGSWHYLNVAPQQALAEAGQAQPENLLVALARFEALLADRQAPPAARQAALRWVVHLVGDAHQPLHAGRKDDLGGNRVQVVWFEQPTNLHRVWDEHLIDQVGWSATEYAAQLPLPSAETRAAWQADPPEVWLQESADLVEAAYPADPALSWSYLWTHRPTVELRLAQAGLRLAARLERALGPSRPDRARPSLRR